MSVIIPFWGLITFYSLAVTLPYNPSRVPTSLSLKTRFRALLPEGFSFFTRNPREPQIVAYQYSGQHLEQLTIQNASLTNMMGILKTSRAQNIETGYLLSLIKGEDWSSCKSSLLNCLTFNYSPIIEMKSKYKKPLLCGDIVLVVRKPVPWAWADNFDVDKMPLEFVRLYIFCDDKSD